MTGCIARARNGVIATVFLRAILEQLAVLRLSFILHNPEVAVCQSAFNLDPLSASNFDPIPKVADFPRCDSQMGACKAPLGWAKF